MRVAMLVGSLLATSGSVMATHERISPARSGLSQLLLLLGRAEEGQHLHVAGVRRRAVDRLGGDQAVPGDLGQRRVLEVGEAGAEALVGQEEVPEPARRAPRP